VIYGGGYPRGTALKINNHYIGGTADAEARITDITTVKNLLDNFQKNNAQTLKVLDTGTALGIVPGTTTVNEALRAAGKDDNARLEVGDVLLVVAGPRGSTDLSSMSGVTYIQKYELAVTGTQLVVETVSINGIASPVVLDGSQQISLTAPAAGGTLEVRFMPLNIAGTAGTMNLVDSEYARVAVADLTPANGISVYTEEGSNGSVQIKNGTFQNDTAASGYRTVKVNIPPNSGYTARTLMFNLRIEGNGQTYKGNAGAVPAGDEKRLFKIFEEPGGSGLSLPELGTNVITIVAAAKTVLAPNEAKISGNTLTYYGTSQKTYTLLSNSGADIGLKALVEKLGAGGKFKLNSEAKLEAVSVADSVLYGSTSKTLSLSEDFFTTISPLLSASLDMLVISGDSTSAGGISRAINSNLSITGGRYAIAGAATGDAVVGGNIALTGGTLEIIAPEYSGSSTGLIAGTLSAQGSAIVSVSTGSVSGSYNSIFYRNVTVGGTASLSVDAGGTSDASVFAGNLTTSGSAVVHITADSAVNNIIAGNLQAGGSTLDIMNAGGGGCTAVGGNIVVTSGSADITLGAVEGGICAGGDILIAENAVLTLHGYMSCGAITVNGDLYIDGDISLSWGDMIVHGTLHL
jgi:hypothetical protein